MRSTLFASFLMGGFEGSDIRFWDGRRVDCIHEVRHDRLCAADYALLRDLGLGTVRDAFRWSRIEQTPGRYDWSSVEPMIQASVDAGIQVIWDLCHFGIPDCVQLCASDFPQRFADYAYQAARLLARLDGRAPWWCPVNEISYWAYAAGTAAYMAPVLPGEGELIKRQLCSAFLAAAQALKAVDGRARVLAADPLIHISEQDGAPSPATAQGFEAWDAMLGRRWQALGGTDSAVDVIGANYYSDNQWRRESGIRIGMGQASYRPLRLLLADLWARYRKPILIAETGAEAPNGPNWLAYVAEEVRQARQAGIAVEGICLYPVMDYPGWVDGRHCPCGPIALDASFTRRSIRPEMKAVLETVRAIP